MSRLLLAIVIIAVSAPFAAADWRVRIHTQHLKVAETVESYDAGEQA